jgi:tripeptidyl-peptidase-1
MKRLLLGFIAIISIAGGARLSLEDAPKEALHSSVLFETHRAPARFQKLGEPPLNGHSITLQIGLKNPRFEDSISSLLAQMSDPSHPEFRTHLNDEEFHDLIQPDDESIGAVEGWLKNHGFQTDQMKWTAHKDWISLERVPLNKVEHMLNTTYHVYRDKGGEHVIRTEKYSLPKYLHRHIDLIQVSIHPSSDDHLLFHFHVIRLFLLFFFLACSLDLEAYNNGEFHKFMGVISAKTGRSSI